MRLGVILDITRTHLISKLKQTSIAAFGVTFGIGTFIILMSFMSGLNQLLDGLILNRTPHVHIFSDIERNESQPALLLYPEELHTIHSIKPKAAKYGIHNAHPIINELEELDNVRGVAPQVTAKVFYLAGAIELNGIINGISVQEEMRLFNFGDYIIKGNAEALQKTSNGILLGAGLAKKMSVDIGNRVQLRTATGEVISLRIIGIYQSGLAEFDNIQGYANIGTVQRLLGEGPNFYSDINVKLKNMEESVKLAQAIEKVFGVTAIDIYQANAQFETGTSIRNLITYAVSITLLIVAGFGIYNILNMLIYEKMNDIAILKATGFSGSDVKLIFISQSFIIGLVGGLLGLIMGFGISVLIDNAPFETEALPTIKTFPVNFDPLYYVAGMIFAMISTFFAGYLPAKKAEKVDPVDIIRGQ